MWKVTTMVAEIHTAHECISVEAESGENATEIILLYITNYS
jgi:hypothetical protein